MNHFNFLLLLENIKYGILASKFNVIIIEHKKYTVQSASKGVTTPRLYAFRVACPIGWLVFIQMHVSLHKRHIRTRSRTIMA